MSRSVITHKLALIFVALANMILLVHAVLPHDVFMDDGEEIAFVSHGFVRGTSAGVERDDFLSVLAAEACSGHHHHGGSSAKCIISENCAAAVRFQDNKSIDGVERASDDANSNYEACAGAAMLSDEDASLFRLMLCDSYTAFINLIIRNFAPHADGLRAPPVC